MHIKVKNLQTKALHQKFENVSTRSKIVRNRLDHSNVAGTGTVTQGIKKCNQNQDRVNCGSVNGVQATKQEYHDHLVLSNRFQIVQSLIGDQEQEHQIYQESPASVRSVPCIKKSTQKKKLCEKIKHDAMVLPVDDNKELILTQQEKSILVGNKKTIKMGHVMGYLKVSSTVIIRIGL